MRHSARPTRDGQNITRVSPKVENPGDFQNHDHGKSSGGQRAVAGHQESLRKGSQEAKDLERFTADQLWLTLSITCPGCLAPHPGRTSLAPCPAEDSESYVSINYFSA